MNVILAGGGTAGHINPALAIAGEIRARHPQANILYVGTKNGLESRLVPQAGFDFKTIDVAGFQRKITMQNIKRNVSALIKVFTSSADSKKIIKQFGPDIVIGTGGYVSGPILRQAQKMGIKTAIHEQNAFPGVTTKMLAPKADAVMLAMPQAEQYLNCKVKPVTTGNPIRPAVLQADRAAARKELQLDDRPMILSFGGSLGARPINQAVAKLIGAHNGSGKYYHFHATGKAGWDPMQTYLVEAGVTKLAPEVTVLEYIHNMDVLLAAADLVICRAGAITLGELAVCGKPSVLIPSPYVAENHQFHNAMTLKNCDAAELIEEKDLTGEKLTDTVQTLLQDPARLTVMAQNAKTAAIADANDRIYGCIMDLLA